MFAFVGERLGVSPPCYDFRLNKFLIIGWSTDSVTIPNDAPVEEGFPESPTGVAEERPTQIVSETPVDHDGLHECNRSRVFLRRFEAHADRPKSEIQITARTVE